MGNVDWIKWDTNPAEIKELDKLAAKADSFETKYQSTIDTEVIDILNQDISSGGLDIYSLNVGGYAPANAAARNVVSSFDKVETKASVYAKKVKKACKEQKEAEKEKLIQEIRKELTKTIMEMNLCNQRIAYFSGQAQNGNIEYVWSQINAIKTQAYKLNSHKLDLEKRLKAAQNI